MDTNRFVVHVITEDVYKDVPEDVKTFDTSNFELNKPLPKEKK